MRQTLVMVHDDINSGPVVKDAGSGLYRRYCYTVLKMFDAASAGWDPITSDDDLEPLLLGSDLEKKLAKHVTTAREMELINEAHKEDETRSTFDFLRNLFEVGADERVQRRISTKTASSKYPTAIAPQARLFIPKASQTPQFSDSEYAKPDHVKHHGSETEFPTPPRPLPKLNVISREDKERLWGHKRGVNKRRATSPPQEYDYERRLSTDSFPRLLSTTDDASDRANSMSSVNSCSSINAAYGTLGLDSPGSGQSSRLMSSSPQSFIPENLQQSDMPRDMSAHVRISQRAAKLGTTPVGNPQGFYMCNCCPKNAKKFDAIGELR